MRRGLLAGIPVVALIAGLATAPADAAPAHTVTLRATGQHRTSVTPRTRPGWTELRNTGSLPMFVVAPRGHAGAQELVAGLNAAPSPRLDRDFRLTTTVDPHQVAYVLLRNGTYLVTDGDHGKAPYRTSQIATLRVSGHRSDVARPKSTRIVVGRNFDPHTSRVVSANHRFVTLVDESDLQVNVIAVPVERSISNAAIDSFLQHPSYANLGRITHAKYFPLAQTAAPKQTIVNPAYPSKGRWMIVTEARLPSGHVQRTLHRGQALLVQVR